MIGYLADPPPSAGSDALFARDVAELGYVMNTTRLWAYQPDVLSGLFGLARTATAGTSLDYRRTAILVAATASGIGDPYCGLAWGTRLAGVAGADVAAAVLSGSDDGLTESERALAGWARAVARNPFTTSPPDVEALRNAGFADAEIFAATVFVAVRVAFSAVNAALGARPDARLEESAPAAVSAAVRGT